MNFGASSYHRYLNGDEAALNELVKEYGDSLVRFAHSFLGDAAASEDVMEDTFATLIVKRKRFEGSNGFKTYLYKIARNKCMDILRHRKRLVPLKEEILQPNDLESDLLLTEEQRLIREKLPLIPAVYRQVLELVYFDELSIEDACKVMHKSRKQMYNLLARAKASLKEILLKAGFTI